MYNEMANMNVTEYLINLMTPMLRFPEALKVATTQDQLGVLLLIDVHKDDMGVVVGKGGEPAKAIRTLVRIVGIRGNARVSVKINEPEGSTYKPNK